MLHILLVIFLLSHNANAMLLLKVDCSDNKTEIPICSFERTHWCLTTDCYLVHRYISIDIPWDYGDMYSFTCQYSPYESKYTSCWSHLNGTDRYNWPIL
jgi:hypothetical protein